MNTEDKRKYVTRSFSILNGGAEDSVSEDEMKRIGKMSVVALDAWIATFTALEAEAQRQYQGRRTVMRHLLYVDVDGE